MNAPTRGEKQRALENTLHNFCPDAVEASELLLALIAGLEERYDTGQVADVLVETNRVLDALDELERTTCSPGNMTKAEPRQTSGNGSRINSRNPSKKEHGSNG
jgi:hypothetical protein